MDQMVGFITILSFLRHRSGIFIDTVW